MHKFGQFDKYTLKNRDNSVTIIPARGGNILELILRGRSIIQGNPTPESLEKNKGSRGIKLIPFPNRIKDGKYHFNGEHQLPINFPKQNHAIHGFLYGKEMKVEEFSDKLKLSYNHDGSYQGYPFLFRVEIIYERDNGFKCTTKITNTDTKDIPIGDGWHSYFTLGGKADDWKLKIPSTQLIEVDDRMIPTGKLIPYSNFQELQPIGTAAFDTGFVCEGKTELSKDDFKITIEQSTEYKNLQIYIPPDRTSIAIEPMTCWPDAFNNKQGLIILKPGESFSGWYSVF